jgi:hypothetical protein
MSAGRSNVLLGKKLKEKSPVVEFLLTAHMPNYLAIVAPDPRLILSVSSLNSLVSSSIFSQPHVSPVPLLSSRLQRAPCFRVTRPGRAPSSVGARPRQAGPARLVANRPESLPCSCSLLFCRRRCGRLVWESEESVLGNYGAAIQPEMRHLPFAVKDVRASSSPSRAARRPVPPSSVPPRQAMG